LSISRSSGAQPLGTTQYTYDADGRLRVARQAQGVDDGIVQGMGVALAYRSCDHLVFNLDPGKRTQVIALIDVRFRPIELGNTLCSFGIFKTEGP